MNTDYFQTLMDEEYIQTHPELSYMDVLILKNLHNKITNTPDASYTSSEIEKIDTFLGGAILHFLQNHEVTGVEGYYLGVLSSNFYNFYTAYKQSLLDNSGKYDKLFTFYNQVWGQVPNFKNFLMLYIPEVKIIGFNISIQEATKQYSDIIDKMIENSHQEIVFDKYKFKDYYTAVISN